MYPKIVFAIFFIFLFGCVSNPTDVKHDDVISNFFNMSSTEQIEQLKGYSLEKQYEIFIFGNQVVHPPAVYLAQPFAEEGANIVPFLKSRLEDTQKDVIIRDIVTVFSEMQRMKLYDPLKDKALMELIGNKVKAMEGIWKTTVQEMVSEMQSVK